MKRRGFIGRMIGLFGVAVAPAAIASPRLPSGQDRGRNIYLSEGNWFSQKEIDEINGHLNEKYWDAQRHINALEDDVFSVHTRTSIIGTDFGFKYGDIIDINGERFLLAKP